MTAQPRPSAPDTMSPPLVETSSGAVIGETLGGVRAFKGIPYARALRFRRAAPFPASDAPRRCTAFGPVAPQPGLVCDGAEADCLTLNVWTPAEIETPLPVLFFIHGGAFVTGAGSDYDGAHLAAHGPAVIVTINYRLGPLGFLQLDRFGGALSEANNLAVTDTLAALDWVGSNIGAFGGNADAITLIGQSAGAALVVTLMTLPQARGKFRGAIAFSVPGRSIMPKAQADEIADRFLTSLELAPQNAAGIIDVPVRTMLETAERVGRDVADHTAHGTLFGPVLDGAIIPCDPRQAIAEGVSRDQSLWLGSCRDEMVMFLKSTPPAAMIRVTETRIRTQFGDAGWNRLLACYSETARADQDAHEALLSDAMWHRPLEELAQLQDKAGGRVWLSRFDHAPQLEPFRSQGPTHGADNACLWAHLPAFLDRPVLKRAGGPMTLADIEVAARLQACVLRFARSGQPEDAAHWPAFTRERRELAVFDSPFRISSVKETPRDRVWRLLEEERCA